MPTSMSRKHFNAIAAVIANSPYLNSEQRETLADRMADALYEFNGRFDRARFVRVATDTSPFVVDGASRGAADMFTAVASGTYDAATDKLDVKPFDARTYWADPANRTVTGQN